MISRLRIDGFSFAIPTPGRTSRKPSDRLMDLHRLNSRGVGASHRSAHGQITRHRARLAVRRTIASAGAGRACTFDVKCLRAKTRAARGDPRQDIPPDTFGGEARLHHRAWRSARYRSPGVENIQGDGAQSVEIRLCQDRHASPKRTGRAALASRLTDRRGSAAASRRLVALEVSARRCLCVPGIRKLMPA